MQKKFITRDCELSTTGWKEGGGTIDSWEVTRELLSKVDPAFRALGSESEAWSYGASMGSYGGSRSMDCLRHWGPDGSCYYSDMSHVEVCTPETNDPLDFAARCFNTLLVAEKARELAEQEAEEGTRYSLSAANSDANDPGISWGTHTNVSVSSELWEDLFVDHMRPGLLGYVASSMAAIVPFFGTGYLVPLKDGSVVYSLSSRAHHITRVHTYSTTTPFERGLLNTRREAHSKEQERLHLIAADYCLISSALFCSFTQCMLAAAEEGYCQMSLCDPVGALQNWSRKLDLATGLMPATAMLVDGRSFTLPGYIGELAGQLLRMCESGLISEEVAPRAKEMLPLVIDLAHYAEEGSIAQCARHLDWAAKLMCLVSSGNPLHSAESRLADHDFANTDPTRGMLWQLWEEGVIDPLIELDDAKACIHAGPTNSRAWGRGQLIQEFMNEISGVGWDYVELREGPDHWGPRLRIDFPSLESCNEAQFKTFIKRARSVEHLQHLLRKRSPAQPVDPLLDINDQLATSISGGPNQN